MNYNGIIQDNYQMLAANIDGESLKDSFLIVSVLFHQVFQS